VRSWAARAYVYARIAGRQCPVRACRLVRQKPILGLQLAVPAGSRIALCLVLMFILFRCRVHACVESPQVLRWVYEEEDGLPVEVLRSLMCIRVR
jgi:hypothetical protein